jgi:predicted DNA binding CopG/RHH family protein
MPAVFKKKSPRKTSAGRVAITIRLSKTAIKSIEREAAKQRTLGRTLIRELLENRFGSDDRPQISL